MLINNSKDETSPQPLLATLYVANVDITTQHGKTWQVRLNRLALFFFSVYCGSINYSLTNKKSTGVNTPDSENTELHF